MVLMLSATFTGMILNHYENALAACLVLNAYIPMLSGTGGNSGTQASVAVIRALSLDEVDFSDVFRVLWKELRVSLLVGVVLTLVYSFLSASHNVITIQVQPRHYAILVVMGAIASVLGILGDLFASSVKRQVGIKDYGTIFPGHGGILDRFDSVMFIAPFVSIAVRYFFYVL